MITVANLKTVLSNLDFEERPNGVLIKQYAIDCLVAVDLEKASITYPDDLKVNDKTTCNFSHNENFVVLECVIRLLDKGYAAEDIELEPKWALGHGAKAGKADIWVRRYKGEKLEDSALLIECKTPGKEFDGAWNDTLEDGAQLFSYFSQEVKTRFLCLYTSDFVDGEIATDYRLINVTDNDEYLKTLIGKRKVLTFTREDHNFEKAGNDKERFRAWAKTYQKEFQTRGLFEDDIDTWDIGKKRYSVSDLKDVSAATIRRKYNEFATILRKYNVSGHENAFDKLVNLFLAKIVDEKENPTELQFYWKGLFWDNYFDFQDRLQRLYKVGMERFLGEDVTYIDDKKIDYAFRLFKNDKDATRDTVQKYVRMLKFFTNNDFAFIDVHNEHLFYQNAVILQSVVNMLKDIKLRNDDLHGEHQLLGDLFEGFLDQGVKQSEGQFFTPMPYVKFMISSLPLWDLVANGSEPPKVIDYACGAGHFLNEYAGQIRTSIRALKKNPEDYFAAITGIEKEYRLSKVTKVAAFMYGQDQIKVVYGDALADLSSRGIEKDGSYNLLVANPPYSVKGFLETLDATDRAKYRLADEVSDPAKCDDIETFFVERAAQLLGDGGLAAIILPSTVLSNDGLFTTCRDILLESFEFVAIAEMGSGTFGKTGTNTVTLFLRRRDGEPDIADHARNRAEAWFRGDFTKDGVFDDAKVVSRYASVIGVDPKDYRTLLVGSPNEALMKAELFANYRAAFAAETKAKKIAAKPLKGDYDAAARAKELEAYVLGRIVETEREKLRVFMLADANPQPVVVVRSPTDTKAVKTFLGYEWSSRKGDEGIKYVGVTTDDEDGISRNRGIDQIQTPLFNPQSFEDASKINTLIRKNFQGKAVTIPEPLAEFVTKVNLVDMIDFSRTDFDKAIQTSVRRKFTVESNYPVVKFGTLCSAINPPKSNIAELPDATLVSFVDMPSLGFGTIDASVTRPLGGLRKGGYTYFAEDDLIIAKITPCMENGKCAVARGLSNGVGMGSSEYHVFRANASAVPMYLFAYINRSIIREYAEAAMTGASGHRRVPIEFYEQLPIPLPPLAIQKKIVSECEKVDAEYTCQQKVIADGRAEIAALMTAVHQHGYAQKEIGELTTELQYGTAEKSLATGKVPVVRMGNIQDGLIDWGDLVYSNNDADIVKYGLKKYDVLFNRTNSPEHVGKVGLYRGEREAIFAGYLIRVKYKPELVDPIYLAYILNSREVREYGFSVMSKSINQANIGGGTLAKYKIPLPTLAEQKKLADKIEKIEAKIAAANVLIASAADKKASVLDKYLK